MKVYLANQYCKRDETYKKALELKKLGFKITSSWLTEDLDPNINITDIPPWYLTKTAEKDLGEIHASEIVVLFTVEGTTPTVRGARHWELGFAYGLGKTCITVGPRENIFYYLPTIRNFPTWEGAKEFLVALKGKKHGKK